LVSETLGGYKGQGVGGLCFFGMFTQHSLVAGYQHFETAFWSLLHGSSSPRRIPETGDDVGGDWFLGKIKEPKRLLEQATFF